MAVGGPVARLKSRLPPAVRRPLGRARSTARWLAVGWYFLARAHRILRAYAAHYARARRTFVAEGNVPRPAVASLRDLGVRVVRPGEPAATLDLPPDFVARVERLAGEVRARLSRSSQCVFVPPLSPSMPVSERLDDVAAVQRGDVLMIQLRDPLEIPGLEDVAAPIMEQMETRVFGSYVTVDKVYVYRSPRSRQAPLGAWLWHYDNHPHEIIKVMVYLTDVAADSGPFEYLRDGATLRPLVGGAVTPLYRDSRVPETVIEERTRGGYERQMVVGPRGTTIVFDDNVVHRANVARAAHRDVIVFQVRPATTRHRPYIRRACTGSFQHAPFSPRPEVLEPFVRRLKHFS
jgi:hypothetical protein